MIRRVAVFLNILDVSGNLSISNVAVIVAVVKMGIATQLTSVDAVALIGTLLNYGHKRMVNSDAQV